MYNLKFRKFNDRFGLVDPEYLWSDHDPTNNGQLIPVSEIDVLLTFDPDLYPDSDSPTPTTYGPTMIQPTMVN